jgi:predicted porin
MKKTLIALAAVAATGAAFAQSSVTLYGVADASIVKTTDVDTKFSSSGTMNNGTSRWGVRGTEDLGGGLKAGFNFEAGLSLADGSVNQSGGNYFSRAAYMNLMGGFGEVRLGRTLNPSFFAAAAWELTGTANYSAVTSQFVSVLGGIRNSNQIAYTTPNFGGVTATVGYIMKGNNGGNAKTDLNVIYRGGPLAVALGYNKVSGSDDNVHIGAKYDFGAFKVAGAYVDPADTTAVDSKGFTIGASTVLGPVALTLDIARDTGFKDTNVLVEAKYPLSKRTFAYAAFLRDGKGKTAANVNNIGLGIRHNF